MDVADIMTRDATQRLAGSVAAASSRRRRKPPDTAGVSVRVRDLAQMFNSFDPSPFWDRDLDQNAAAFIEGEFRDRRRAERWVLHVHAHEGMASASDLQAAVQRYYERLLVSLRLQLREQIRVAEIALAAGLAVFAICITLQTTLRHLPSALDQGLIILAWVALWRPIESLAYGWVPLFSRRRLYERLRRVHVRVRIDTRRSAAPSASSAPHSDPAAASLPAVTIETAATTPVAPLPD